MLGAGVHGRVRQSRLKPPNRCAIAAAAKRVPAWSELQKVSEVVS